MNGRRNAFLVLGFMVGFGQPMTALAGVCACDADIVAPIGGLLQPNVADISQVLQCALGNAPPEDCALADVNCDGMVTFADVGAAMLQVGVPDPSACDVPVGACCTDSGVCRVEQEGLCSGVLGNNNPDAIGTYSANGVTCDQLNCATGTFVPAASEWGLATFMLALLIMGSIILRARFAPTVASDD